MTVVKQDILKADADKYLTNGETYAKIVYLGINDSIENWHEITEEEYQKAMEEQEAETNAESAQN